MSNKKLVLASAGCFTAACLMPALRLHVGSHNGPNGPMVFTSYVDQWGYMLLVMSALGPLAFNFTGAANVLLLLSWILIWMRSWRAATWASGAALGFSLQTWQLLWRPWWFDEGGVVLGYLTKPLAGYFFWMLSMLIAFVFSWRRWKRAKELSGPWRARAQAR